MIEKCSTNYLMKTYNSEGWDADQLEEIRVELTRRWMAT